MVPRMPEIDVSNDNCQKIEIKRSAKIMQISVLLFVWRVIIYFETRMTQRVFFAFPIPEEIKLKLQEPFKDLHYANIRFIAARNLHITAYFIGNVEEKELEKIKLVGRESGDRFR